MQKLLYSLLTTAFTLAFAQYVSAQAIINTYAGDGIIGYTDSGGVRTHAEFNHPWGLVFDASGNLFIADHVNAAIRKISSAGVVSTYGGNTTTGYAGDGGPATNAMLGRPASLVLDAAGNLYIADGLNNNIRKITPSDSIYTFAGRDTAGYTGDGGPATAATFNTPTGIARDAAGNIYVADSGNNVIRKIDPSGTISTFAGTGAAGYTGDGGAATAATFNGPIGISIDAGGNFYIADHVNNVVRKINTSGIVSTFAGTGVQGYGGDEGPATAALLSEPNTITFDKYGNVLISDETNNRIRSVSPTGKITTVAGIGSVGYSGDGGPALAAQLFRPMGIAFDSIGNLYIADYINTVVRIVNMSRVQVNEVAAPFKVISISPDPATDHISVVCSNSSGSEAMLEIRNTLGQVVYKGPANDKSDINISEFSTGCYILNYYCNGERLASEKFLKR